MSPLNLMLSEIRFRWLNSLLTLAAIVAAGTLLVGGPTIIAGYSAKTNELVAAKEQELTKQLDEQRTSQAEKLAAKQAEMQTQLDAMVADRDKTLAEMDKRTTRLMRDIGFNVMIFHKDTDMTAFHSEHQAVDMPEKYVHDLAESKEITKVRHLVATLQQKLKWNDRSVVLMGILPAVTQSHLAEKDPMGYKIKPGTVLLGHELAGDKFKAGDTITVGVKDFTIAQVLPEQGTKEDVMIAMELHDAQAVLNKPDKINQIMALGCDCKVDRLGEIREQLEKVLPETRVTEFRSAAIARGEQRKLVGEKHDALIAATQQDHTKLLTKEQEASDALLAQKQTDNEAIVAGLAQSRAQVQTSLVRMFNVAAPLVVVLAIAWIGLLAWSNVRERRPEIGILRALGKPSSNIAALFLGKALLLGIIGGAIACGIGFFVAASFGEAALETAQLWLLATLIGAPLVAVVGTYLPTIIALGQDPALVLREQ